MKNFLLLTLLSLFSITSQAAYPIIFANDCAFDIISQECVVTGAVSSAWGDITGTLSDQTDLQSALDAKEPSVSSGTTSQYYRGDKTFQTLDTLVVAENTNLYFTNARVLGLLSATAPIVDTAGVFSIPASTNSVDGYLTSADHTSFSAKEPAISSGTTSQYWRGDKTFQTLDKSAVGVPNIDNTSDANKPVSTATQTALNLKANISSLATVATSGAYADLSGKPTLLSQFTNDSGYITGSTFPSKALYVSKNGSDVDSCTFISPCLTIQKAIDVATAVPSTFNTPMSIEVYPGKYTEDLSFTQQGISIKCNTPMYHVDSCQLYGGITINLSGTSGGGNFVASNNNIAINGLEVFASGAKNAILFSGTAFQRLFVNQSFITQSTTDSANSALLMSNTGTSGGTKSTITSRDTDFKNNSTTNATIELQAGRMFDNGANLDITNAQASGQSILLNGSAATGPSMYLDTASVTGQASLTDNTAILQFSNVAIGCGTNSCISTPSSPSTGYFIGGNNLFTTTNTNVISGTGIAVLSGSNFLGSSGVAIAGTVTQAPLAQLPQGVIKPSGVLVSGLSASLPVKTDASKNLVTAAINLASGTEVTGTLPYSKGGTNNASAYTIGSVVFADGSKLTEDNSNFYWDDTNNRLGLSTITPAHKFHVASSVTTGAQVGIENRENTTASAAATVLLKRSRGTAGAPTAVSSGDSLGFFGITGYGATTYPTTASAGMLGVATEAHSDTVKGSKLTFRITPNGGLVNRNAIDIGQDGSLGLNGLTSGTLSILPAATTSSHTLTMPSAQGATDSVLLNNGSGSLSWSNLPASKVVNTPAGNIAATEVQAAINELDSEKQASLGFAFITNSGAVDFASILAGASNDQTLTVTGAAVGDVVACGKPSDQDANLTVECFVSATNTVTFRAHNVSVAVTVDQASKTYKATVLH